MKVDKGISANEQHKLGPKLEEILCDSYRYYLWMIVRDLYVGDVDKPTWLERRKQALGCERATASSIRSGILSRWRDVAGSVKTTWKSEGLYDVSNL